MKKTTLILSLLFVCLMSFTQQPWYTQNSGTSSYLFDVCFADQYSGWASGASGLILHTTDGGINWIPQTPPPNNAYFSIFFTTDQYGWASGYGGKIIFTSNGGATWNEQSSGTNTFLYQVYFINQNEGWLVGGDYGSFPTFIKQRVVLHTTNGGNSWFVQLDEFHESPLFDIFFLDQDMGFAVGESGIILQTNNGGISWVEQMSNQLYHFYSVYFTKPSIGYVVGTYLGLPHVSVIFNTTDGGATWTPQTYGTDETLSDVFFIDEDHGWAVGGNATSSVVMNTTDGGENWNYMVSATNKSLSSVFFIDQHNGWATGHLGTIISTNILTGINLSGHHEQLDIYPNPAKDQITIDVSSFSTNLFDVSLINSIGEVVYRANNAIGSQTYILNIDTSHLKDGLYILVVKDSMKVGSSKVLIQG